MNEIQFDEEQLKDLQAIGSALFSEDSSDPRSWNYKRHLIRPTIRWMRALIFVSLLFAGTFGAYFFLYALWVPPKIILLICLAGVLIVLLLFFKQILIFLIQVYQRYAPDSIRNKCRFEPSCSQYMILSLQKYGLLKGLSLGINRLKRCNTEGGGFDYP